MWHSCWLTPAVQKAPLPCSRRWLNSAAFFISTCSEGSSPSLPLFAAWLCLSSLLSRSPLIWSWVLYSCSLGLAEREIDCSQFSSRLNCIDLFPIHADVELCYLLITMAIPSQHQWSGWKCGGTVRPWGKTLEVCRCFVFFCSGFSPWILLLAMSVGLQDFASTSTVTCCHHRKCSCHFWKVQDWQL